MGSDNQARIAELIRPWLRRQRDAEDLAELVAQLVYPRIETVEQLDALPHEAVVLLLGPEGGVRAALQKRYGTWHWANDDGDDSWSEELKSFLPARLLWHPEVDCG
ncbi:hypothetical protein KD933_gp55 [Mycobacterium phage Rebel]|uniref:Uncharacterized protein n=1 Tax=Mycobacterium phage Rebel TaxID=2743932 RepID=A0AA48V6H4_9CAUD|nr:hypothetical protein KD933_gp55 [Mycobacterium phage Rebel]QKY78932.1 hypothetical protein SEA_REBEL_55 [Mycobacterium phage Rebel]